LRHGGNTSALTVKTALDGRVCVLTVTGDLDCLSVTQFLMLAARAVDKRTERLVLDLGGLTFLDAAGARALAMAAQYPPSSCPVIIRSLSARARRVLDLMDLDLGQEPVTGPEHHDTLARATRKRSHLTALSRSVPGREYRPSAGVADVSNARSRRGDQVEA
jgi:anti-anti-sigma factor